MVSFPRRAALRFLCALNLVGLLLSLPLAGGTLPVGAQEALSPGMTGLVANSGGEPVLLRDAPGYESGVVSSFWEGTPVQVGEGPLYGADGSAWYGVTVGGAYGYMAAGYLAPDWAAAEAVPTEMAAAPAPAATETMTATQEAPVTTADLNLRTGPSYDDAIITVIPAGALLESTGEWLNGFAGVVYAGQYGWVDGGYLGSGEVMPVPVDAPAPSQQEVTLLQEAAPAPDDASGLVGDLSAPAGTPAQVVDIANLRVGPSEMDDVLRVLPAGASLTITGASSGGFTPVWYNGTWGFVSDYLLAAGQAAPVTMAQEAVPVDMTVDDGSSDLIATTLSDVNLRAGPSYNDMVLGIIPAGAELYPYAGQESGFYQVDANGQTGWIAAEFLQVSVDYEQRAKRNRDQSGKVENSEPAGNADASYGGGIIWPVSGGSWSIMQGYNGSSHQNQDSLWQYYYSLDLVRDDGGTAGQTVYSPVNGVVRWTDPGSGGISIDMGDGYAVAMFHVAFDGSLQAGTPVSQGQPIGTISGSGGPGFAGTPHLHFTLWTSDDNGNWDREAVPFTGKYAIAGMDFPDVGGSYQHSGTTFYP